MNNTFKINIKLTIIINNPYICIIYICISNNIIIKALIRNFKNDPINVFVCYLIYSDIYCWKHQFLIYLVHAFTNLSFLFNIFLSCEKKNY